MTYKWIFTEWGEPHSSDLPADAKGFYVLYDHGVLHRFDLDEPNKETA